MPLQHLKACGGGRELCTIIIIMIIIIIIIIMWAVCEGWTFSFCYFFSYFLLPISCFVVSFFPFFCFALCCMCLFIQRVLISIFVFIAIINKNNNSE